MPAGATSRPQMQASARANREPHAEDRAWILQAASRVVDLSTRLSGVRICEAPRPSSSPRPSTAGSNDDDSVQAASPDPPHFAEAREGRKVGRPRKRAASPAPPQYVGARGGRKPGRPRKRAASPDPALPVEAKERRKVGRPRKHPPAALRRSEGPEASACACPQRAGSAEVAEEARRLLLLRARQGLGPPTGPLGCSLKQIALVQRAREESGPQDRLMSAARESSRAKKGTEEKGEGLRGRPRPLQTAAASDRRRRADARGSGAGAGAQGSRTRTAAGRRRAHPSSPRRTRARSGAGAALAATAGSENDHGAAVDQSGSGHVVAGPRRSPGPFGYLKETLGMSLGLSSAGNGLTGTPPTANGAVRQQLQAHAGHQNGNLPSTGVAFCPF